MNITNFPTPTPNLVNYSDLPTDCSNEIYIPETETPESTSFLLRNSVFIELSWPVKHELSGTSKKVDPVSSSVYYI